MDIRFAPHNLHLESPDQFFSKDPPGCGLSFWMRSPYIRGWDKGVKCLAEPGKRSVHRAAATLINLEKPDPLTRL